MKSNLIVSHPNVDDLSIDEILELATDNEQVVGTKQRYNLLRLLYRDVFHFDLEKDLTLAIIDETPKKLILAPAGAGKTSTVFGAGMIIEKLCRKSRIRTKVENGKIVPCNIHGDNILCLVYNRHNVQDIKKRHTQLVNQLLVSGLKGLGDLNDSLDVSTMHGFCTKWLNDKDYSLICGIKGRTLVTEEEQDHLMSTALNKVLIKLNSSINIRDVKINDLNLLYGFKRETMMSYDDLRSNENFIDLGLPMEIIQRTFDMYDSVKSIKRKIDFTDQLLIFYKFISGGFDIEGQEKDSEKFLARLRDCYEYIAADECQDFTPLMNSILKIISKDQPLVCIGDDDQSLYGFKGADPNSILKFQDRYPDSKVFLLKTNRRCPSNVVELSKFIIEHNELRFDKDIGFNKPDGTIDYRSYNDRRGQIMSVIEDIKSMNDENKNSTCICYRNSSSSSDIANLLMEARIPFHILAGTPPFDYGLYKAVIDVLRDLNSGSNKTLHLNLYKCLPLTRDEMCKILDYDPIKKEFRDGSSLLHLSKLNFGKRMQNQTFVQNLNWLLQVSKNIDTLPLRDYFPRLLKMIKLHYWDFLVKVTGKDKDADESFTNSIIKYFCVDKTFSARYVEYESDLRTLKANDIGHKGVCISTFHSLKGLEFNNVYVVDLKESIYPNSSFIDFSLYDEPTKQRRKEEETRLFYVAITRAKKRLVLYYDKQDPSVYLTWIFSSYSPVKRSVVSTIDLEDTSLVAEPSNITEEIPSIEFSSKFNIDNVDETIPEEDNKPKSITPKADYKKTIMDAFFK